MLAQKAVQTWLACEKSLGAGLLISHRLQEGAENEFYSWKLAGAAAPPFRMVDTGIDGQCESSSTFTRV